MNTSRLAALLLGLVLTAALTAHAALFGTEQRLFQHTPGIGAISNNPIVHASGSNVYIAWSTVTTTSDIWVRVSTNNGDSFGPAINVSNGGGHPNTAPVIVGDGANVHVFWTDDQNTGSIFYARSINNGASFGAVQTLVNQPGYSRVTSALISNSQVHLVFYDNRAVAGAGIAGRVYHKLSCDSGANWSTETNVTQFDGDVDNEQPRLAQLDTGEIFLSFRSTRNGVPQGGWPPFQIYLLRMNMSTTSCPSGATWFYPAQRLSRGSDTDLGGNYAANIFPGANGGLHAAWWNDTAGTNLVYRYGKPNGGGFGAQQDLSGFGLNHPQLEHMTERTGFGIGEDATGQVHAIFLQYSELRLGFQTGSLWYRCSPAPVGSAFAAKQLVGGSALASEPRAFYSSGRFHIVWQDYRNTTIDQSEIYYNYANTATTCTGPIAPPSAPTNVSVMAGSGMMTVNFGPPASNGGAAITGYSATCTSSNGGVSGSNTGGAAAVSIVVSGLTNGKSYTCTVTATNAGGMTGPASAPSNAVRPFDFTPILMLLLLD